MYGNPSIKQKIIHDVIEFSLKDPMSCWWQLIKENIREHNDFGRHSSTCFGMQYAIQQNLEVESTTEGDL